MPKKADAILWKTLWKCGKVRGKLVENKIAGEAASNQSALTDLQ